MLGDFDAFSASPNPLEPLEDQFSSFGDDLNIGIDFSLGLSKPSKPMDAKHFQEVKKFDTVPHESTTRTPQISVSTSIESGDKSAGFKQEIKLIDLTTPEKSIEESKSHNKQHKLAIKIPTYIVKYELELLRQREIQERRAKRKLKKAETDEAAAKARTEAQQNPLSFVAPIDETKSFSQLAPSMMPASPWFMMNPLQMPPYYLPQMQIMPPHLLPFGPFLPPMENPAQIQATVHVKAQEKEQADLARLRAQLSLKHQMNRELMRCLENFILSEMSLQKFISQIDVKGNEIHFSLDKIHTKYPNLIAFRNIINEFAKLSIFTEKFDIKKTSLDERPVLLFSKSTYLPPHEISNQMIILAKALLQIRSTEYDSAFLTSTAFSELCQPEVKKPTL